MKATGVIRRIDELGRIVIPKEIRRNLRIRDGENMEIFVDNSSIILKKISKMEDSLSYIQKIMEMLESVSNDKIIVTDRDHIISTTNINENLKDMPISSKIIEFIDERKIVNFDYPNQLAITNDYKVNCYYTIYPIISGSDSMGVIIVLSDNKIDAEKNLLIKFVSLLINTQLDI